MLRLFIENKELDVDYNEDIVTTHAVNKIGDIASRDGVYSNVFKLPKTEKNIRTLQMIGVINGAGRLQYKRSVMRMETDGLTLDGFGMISSVDSKINVRFMASNYDWGDLIGTRKLSGFEYPEANHEWTLTNVLASRISDTEPYAYANADFGNGQGLGTAINFMYLRPFYRAKYIFEKLFSLIGYSVAYSISTQNKIFELYEQMIICKEDSEMKTVDALIVNASLPAPQAIPTTDPINNDVYPLNLTSDSEYWNNATFEFTAPVRGRYKVKLIATYLEPIGTVPNIIGIGLITNGVGFAGNSFIENQKIEYLFNTEFLQGYVISMSGFVINDPLLFETFLTASLEIELIEQFQISGMDITARWMMPKMNAKDFIKAISNQFGFIFRTDQQNQLINISQFDEILDYIPQAQNLSDKHVNQQTDDQEYSLGYAQNNYFRYLTDDKDSQLLINPDYGIGNITVNDQTLKVSDDFYQVPFAPVFRYGTYDDSGDIKQAALVPYLDMSKLELWDVTKSYVEGDHVQYNGMPYTAIAPSVGDTPGIDPQWRLSYLGAAQEIKTRIAYIVRNNSLSLVIDGAPATPTYLENQQQVYFDSLVWANLLTEHYELLRTVLIDTVTVKAQFLVRGIDIDNIDFTRPIYLDYYKAYFYLDSINQFNHTKKQTTTFNLIKVLP
jgi:hypothetical protein